MRDPLARYYAGNRGEELVRRALRRCGVGIDQVEEQFPIGPYRLDFAFPLQRVAIESDGWVHQNSSVVRSDRVRDRKLDAWGWTVYRVNVEADVDDIERRIEDVLSAMDYVTLHRQWTHR